MEEVSHIIQVISGVEKALKEEDTVSLRTLSNQTIHSASIDQDAGSITLAVLVYALSKLIERGDQYKIKGWTKFIKKITLFFDLATDALKTQKLEAYERHLEGARKSLNSVAGNLKTYITEVLRKSSLNKASKIYEHGISMGQTAKLLGVSQWELSEYTGQKPISDNPYNETLSVKKRVQMTEDFFK